MSFWDNLFGGGQGAANKDIQDAIAKAEQEMQQQYQQGRSDISGALSGAQGGLNPYMQAGVGGLGAYQNALAGMADPQAYYNKIMSGYQESPTAQYQQQQAIKAATSAGTASGTLGSGELGRQMEQQSQQISSQDMQNYLNNVLGINNQYLSGESGLAGMGQQAANQSGQWGMNAGEDLARMASQYGIDEGNLIGQMGQAKGQGDLANSNMWRNMIGSGGALAKILAGLF